ncbi:MAG: efflux RND transporter periplasmic adaptor subunit [Waddliaceae bacterium]
MKAQQLLPFINIVILGFIGSLPANSNDISEPETMTFPVILEPLERTEIYPEVNARIEVIKVKMGDSFKEEELLLRMENKVYYAQVEKTKKAIEKATEDLSVKKNLYEDGLISYLELLESEANFAEAEADYEIAHKNLTSTIIIAPYDGKVATVYARLHEIPPKEKPMIEILNDRTLLARFIIPATYLTKLKKGNPVFIYIKDLDQILPATIARVGAEINPVSYTINVEAEVDNSQGKLASGMASVIALHKSALSTSPDETLEDILEELSEEK